MILVDNQGHLISTTSEQELQAFARKINLKESWFQNAKRPHYDLTTKNKINQAMRAGATLVSPKVIASFFKHGGVTQLEE